MFTVPVPGAADDVGQFGESGVPAEVSAGTIGGSDEPGWVTGAPGFHHGLDGLSGDLFTGLEDLPVGARSIGMGATYVALANTADAIFLNPGGLSQLNGAEISVFYQRPFGLTDLDFGMVAASFAFRSHRLGLGFLQFGNRLYNEQVLALTYSRSYQQKLHCYFLSQPLKLLHQQSMNLRKLQHCKVVLS